MGQPGISVINQVAFEYGPWGAVTKSMQDHDAAAGSTDPNVEYAYEEGIASNEAKFVRPDYVTYPGPGTRRVVYYNYPTSGKSGGKSGDILQIMLARWRGPGDLRRREHGRQPATELGGQRGDKDRLHVRRLRV